MKEPKPGDTIEIGGKQFVAAMMTVGRVNTLIHRDQIIDHLVIGSPMHHWSVRDCQMFLANPGEDWPSQEERDTAVMMAELRLMMHGEIPAAKSVPDLKLRAERIEEDDRVVVLRMKKKHWIRAQMAFQASFGFLGTLSFDGEVLGRGFLISPGNWLGLEPETPDDHQLQPWEGVREGTLTFAPDAEQPPLPRRAKEIRDVKKKTVGADGKPTDLPDAIRHLIKQLVALGVIELPGEPKGWVSGPFFEPPTAHD